MEEIKKKVVDNIANNIVGVVITIITTGVIKLLKSKVILAIIILGAVVGIGGFVLSWIDRAKELKIKHEEKYNLLMKGAKKHKKKRTKVGYNANKLNNNYEKQKQFIKRRYMNYIIWMLAIVIIICSFNLETVLALKNDIKYCVGLERKQEKVSKKQEDKKALAEKGKTEDKQSMDSDNMKEQRKTQTKEKKIHVTKNVRRKKPEEYCFVLKYKKLDNWTKNTEIQYVMGVKNPVEWLEEHKNRKENCSQFKEIMNKKGKNFSDYSQEENIFVKDIEKSKEIVYLDEWEEKAPSSEKLDDIIVGKRSLTKILKKKGIENYKIWWSLANNYQSYAIEYANQTNEEEKTTYFYLESIYCSMMALEFSNSNEVDTMIWKYMVARYNDLMLEDEIVQDYRRFASEVWKLLITEDVDIGDRV